MVPAWNGTRQKKKLKLKKCCILSNSCNWQLFLPLLLFFQTFLQLIIWWCTKFEKFSKFLANMLLLQSREDGKFWTWMLWKDKCLLFVKSSRRRKTLISHEALNWWPLDFVVSELQRTCWSAKAMYRVLSYSLLSHTYHESNTLYQVIIVKLIFSCCPREGAGPSPVAQSNGGSIKKSSDVVPNLYKTASDFYSTFNVDRQKFAEITQNKKSSNIFDSTDNLSASHENLLESYRGVDNQRNLVNSPTMEETGDRLSRSSTEIANGRTSPEVDGLRWGIR